MDQRGSNGGGFGLWKWLYWLEKGLSKWYSVIFTVFGTKKIRITFQTRNWMIFSDRIVLLFNAVLMVLLVWWSDRTVVWKAALKVETHGEDGQFQRPSRGVDGRQTDREEWTVFLDHRNEYILVRVIIGQGPWCVGLIIWIGFVTWNSFSLSVILRNSGGSQKYENPIRGTNN